MIWADRVALVWALTVWGFILLTGQLSDAGPLGLLLTVGPWVLMRALDFIFAGKIRSSAR